MPGDYLQLQAPPLAVHWQFPPQLQLLSSLIVFTSLKVFGLWSENLWSFALSVLGQFKNLEHFVDGLGVFLGVVGFHHVTDVRAQVVLDDEFA